MKITSYEKIQGEGFDTTQPQLFRVQRVEVDNAVFYARKGESFTDRAVLSTISFDSSTCFTGWNSSFNSPVTSKPYSTSLYTLPFLSTDSDFRLTPASNTPYSHYSFPSRSHSSPYHGFKHNDGISRYRHPIICYFCNQSSNISSHCLSLLKE